MNLLITGAAGFVGSFLAEKLEYKHLIITIKRVEKDNQDNTILADLAEDNLVEKIVGKLSENNVLIDIIIHLAARTASSQNIEDISVLQDNNQISLNLAKLALKLNVKKVINFSSMSVYAYVDGTFDEKTLPNPVLNTDAIYGISKLNSEYLLNFFLRNTLTNIIHLRVAMIYGENMPENRIIPMMKKELAETNIITIWGTGERVLNLISLDYLYGVIDFFIEKQQNNTFNSDVFNVVEKQISMKDLAEEIAQKYGNSNSKVSFIEKKATNTSKFFLDGTKLKELNLKDD